LATEVTTRFNIEVTPDLGPILLQSAARRLVLGRRVLRKERSLRSSMPCGATPLFVGADFEEPSWGREGPFGSARSHLPFLDLLGCIDRRLSASLTSTQALRV